MTAILFISVLVVLILVHEFGHFIFAKMFNVKVEEFGIGYPPKALTLFKGKETKYTLNWIPFGGFVRLLGENPGKDEGSKEYKERSLASKGPAKKIAILFAGVLFNFIFAWGLFSYVFYSGTPLFWDKNYLENSELVISGTLANSPAQIAGLAEGDTIVKVSEKETSQTPKFLSPGIVSEFISARAGKTIVIEYLDKSDDRVKTVEITPAQSVLPMSPQTPAVGMSMTLVSKEKVTFGKAVINGFKTSIDVAKDVTVGIGRLAYGAVSGQASLKDVAGPVGIADMVSSAASVGFAYLLYFVALISVNLSVINLIPIPALDGGRIMFILIELITRRKMPAFVENSLNFVGFALLIILMLAVTYNDILRIFL